MPNEDGNTSQWDKLKAMREAGGEKPTAAPEKPAEQTRNADGTFAKVDDAAAAEIAAAEAAKLAEAQAATLAAETAAAEAAKAATPPVDDGKPRSVEIEIDGQKVNVDPSLADAFSKAEKIKVDTTKATERDALKAELREELKAEFAPPPKTDAEKAADAALKAAEDAAKLPKKPDFKLMIDDPEEYQRQADVFDEARTAAAVAKAKAETLATIQQHQQDAARAGEEQARSILREQFFQAYPVLRDSAVVVDPILDAKFAEVVASGKLAKPLSAEAREALKATEFADVATKATREVVKLMNAGKKIAPPPAPPPTLVSTAPAKPKAEKKDAPPVVKEKYPKGSVSALLAERKASRFGVTA